MGKSISLTPHYRGGGGGMGEVGGRTPHPTIFFKKPFIKTDVPPRGAHLHLKMKPPHLKKHPFPPLKREAPFHEMIPRKSTINNNLQSS